MVHPPPHIAARSFHKTNAVVPGPNPSRVLSLIRDAEISGDLASRAWIARQTGLSAQAVSNIVADLSKRRLIRAAGRRKYGVQTSDANTAPERPGRGQPPVLYETDPDGAFALGFELRRDALVCTLLNLRGKAVFWDKNPLDPGKPETLQTEARALFQDALALRPAAGQRLLGAAIVVTGQPWAGQRGADAARLISEAVGLHMDQVPAPAAVAVAERVSGVARGMQNYAALWFDDGPEGSAALGIVTGARPLTGRHGRAGAIGKLPLPGAAPDSDLCLADVLSIAAMRRHFEAMGETPPMSFAETAAHFKSETPALLAWVDRAQPVLKQLVKQITAYLDPEAIILCGGLPHVVLKALSAGLPDAPDAPPVLAGHSGEMTVALGAAATVLNDSYTRG